MEAITAASYPEHWKIYENLTNKVNAFISDNPELVSDILKQQNAASHEPKPLPLLPLYFDERSGLGGTDGSYIKLNEKFKDLPINMFESTLAHEMSHVFFDDPSILSKVSIFDLHAKASENECRADHFSIFFSSDEGKGRIEKYDGTTYDLMGGGMPKELLRALYKSTISVHPSNEKGVELAKDDNLKAFAPGTILLDAGCNYDPKEITHQSLQSNIRDVPSSKSEDGHSK